MEVISQTGCRQGTVWWGRRFTLSVIVVEGQFGQQTWGRCEGLECQGKVFELYSVGNGKPWKAFKRVNELIKESF